MKYPYIKKFGQVTISEIGVDVTNFEFDLVGDQPNVIRIPGPAIDALFWAKEELNKAIEAVYEETRKEYHEYFLSR